jgi:ribosomal protein S18 acetylase RimI-like enzyme
VGQEGTELERLFIGLVGSEVAGLYACVSTEALPTVMMEGSLRLLRGLDPEVRLDFLARLKEARPSLPALPENSLYLARVAVAESYQGRGVSKALMEDFFGRLDKETSWCLHVLTDNARALRFFRRFGFERFGEEEAGYLAMVRPTD